MRNLREYPVTDNEVLDELDGIGKSISTSEGSPVVGGTGPLILGAVRNLLGNNPEMMEILLDDLKIALLTLPPQG